MPVIDVHCHTTPRSVIAEIQRVAKGDSPKAAAARELLQRPNFLDDPQMVGALDERIPLMDEGGLDVQILSSPFALGHYFADLGQRAAAAQALNDEFSAACGRHGSRYRFFAALPLPDVPGSIRELDRASRLTGFAGTIMLTNFGLPFHHPSLEDLYAEYSSRKILMFIHPTRMERVGRYADMRMETMIGWPAEDTLAVMEIVLSGLLDRHPHFTVIAPHLGGTSLYLAGRIDHSYDDTPPAERRAAERPTVYLKRLYYDCVCDSPLSLELARGLVGAQRIVLGSDFPFWHRERLGDCLKVIDGLDWPEEELSLIRGGNMERLLRERRLL
jgi:aminocarboxymuconate-semialdehyde decarboxylase